MYIVERSTVPSAPTERLTDSDLAKDDQCVRYRQPLGYTSRSDVEALHLRIHHPDAAPRCITPREQQPQRSLAE